MEKVWKLKGLLWISCLICFMTVGSLQVRAEKAQPTDLSKAIKVDTTQEAITALKNAMAIRQEETVLYVNYNKVPIKNEKEGWGDLHSSIYRSFDGGYVGGLLTSLQPEIYSGPWLGSVCYEKEGGVWWNDFLVDENNPDYQYCVVVFQYATNNEELAQVDTKIESILKNAQGYSDADTVKYVYSWMQKNLPEEKMSDDGYPRNCGGVYGALFGDGTGYSCSTYAYTIQRFMEKAGIQSYILSGAYQLGDPCHAYNVVKINGEWYVVDYTTQMVLAGKEDYQGISMYREMIGKYMSGYKMAEKSWTDAEPGTDAKPGTEPETDAELDVKPDSGSGTIPGTKPDPAKDPKSPNRSNVTNLKKGYVTTVSKAKYKVTSNKTSNLTVSYLGSFSKSSKITIPSAVKIKGSTYKVTSIGANAFKNNKRIQKVTIGKYVKSIGKNAFWECNRLSAVIFKGSQAPKIGSSAFKNIKKSAKFYVPKKRYTAYKKQLTSKKGIKKTMKIKKA